MTVAATDSGDRLGTRRSAGYALGSLVTGTFATVPGLLLLPYLTDTLGIAAAVAGVLAFIPKAWNIALNPVVGRVSDRTHTRMGPRRPYVLLAGLGVAVTFASMFAGPASGVAGAAWVTVGYLLMASVFAFFQVPYAAMPAEITTGYAERTRLMSWRVAAIALTVLLTGALAPIVVRAAGDGIPGYRAMGVVIGTIVAVGAVAAFVGTRRIPHGAVSASEPSLRRQLAVARDNRPFRWLLWITTIQSASAAALLAGVTYFARHILHDDEATAGLFVAFTLPAVLLLPVMVRFAARADKRAGLFVSSSVFVVLSLGLLGVPSLGMLAILALVAALGCSNAVQDTFVLSLLPDCIDFDTAGTGRRQAGVFSGLFSGAQSLGFALGPLLFGVVLQLAGYLPSTTGIAAEQSSDTTARVLIGFAVLPALLTALSLPAVRRYHRTASPT